MHAENEVNESEYYSYYLYGKASSEIMFEIAQAINKEDFNLL